MNNPLLKWLLLIRRGTYQAVAGDIKWTYEPVSYLWPDIEAGSDSRYDDVG